MTAQTLKHRRKNDKFKHGKKETLKFNKLACSPSKTKKNFTCYTMDLTKKYLEINSDYRT